MPGVTATATVCDNLALYGGGPDRDELDSREVWDRSEAEFALAEAVSIMVRGVAIEGSGGGMIPSRGGDFKPVLGFDCRGAMVGRR